MYPALPERNGTKELASDTAAIRIIYCHEPCSKKNACPFQSHCFFRKVGQLATCFGVDICKQKNANCQTSPKTCTQMVKASLMEWIRNWSTPVPNHTNEIISFWCCYKVYVSDLPRIKAVTSSQAFLHAAADFSSFNT